MTSKVDDGQHTIYTVRGDRLLESKLYAKGVDPSQPAIAEPVPIATASYAYWESGAVKEIAATSGPVTERTRYEYDAFDRVTRSKGPEATAKETGYGNDGLDRRDWRCDGGSDGRKCTGGDSGAGMSMWVWRAISRSTARASVESLG